MSDEHTQQDFLVTDYGAQSDLNNAQTVVFQRCIDACQAHGGGRVVVPQGRFIIGSIRLFSHITFYLQTGAVLVGSENLADYTNFGQQTGIRYLQDPAYIKRWHLPAFYFHALIAAYDATDVSIIGAPGSLIDGRDVYDARGEEGFRGPMGIVFARVQHVQLQGYTFENSANWSHTLSACQDVHIDAVTILAGHDGFNLHHSRDITIQGCLLQTGDDCLAGYDITNLTVTRCLLNTACNGMRIGGDHLHFSACVFAGPGRFPHRSEDTYDTHAFFKYYAMAEDIIATKNTDIVWDHCVAANGRRFMTYMFGDRENVQYGSPLHDVTFSYMTISGIQHMSRFLGNGQPVTLKLTDCTITPPAAESFLQIDASVHLQLTNVRFTAPTVIETTAGDKLTFTNTVNVDWQVSIHE